ncbi:MAG: alpha/beta hydrolase [Verrucomicrobiota bacterium JB023]|nr:alpha/beta hydrolase [Verrucomicrobiota bacterium JB023]
MKILLACLLCSASAVIAEELAPILLRNQAYAGTENPRQTLNLAVPARSPDASLPLVVFIHGGGWAAGSKMGGLRRLQPLYSTGQYATATIGYRLTREAIWPAQIHDCKAAIRWLRANAGQYGIDAGRIALFGLSAGGHLAAMLGTSAEVPALEGELGPHAEASSRVACVVDYFGPTRFLPLEGEPAIKGEDNPRSAPARLLGGLPRDKQEAARSASPLTHITGDDAPTLIVHGTRDRLVALEQSEWLRDGLRQAGVPVTLVTVDGGGHGQGFGEDVWRVTRDFLEHHLLGIQRDWKDMTIPAATK